jgi:CBS domain-containing protein
VYNLAISNEKQIPYHKQSMKEILEDQTLGKALSLFNKSMDVLIVLNKKKEYTGILFERNILRTDLDPGKSKVKSFKSPAPKVNKSTSMEECARLMIENNLLFLPVFDKKKISNVLSYTEILKSQELQKLGKHTIKEIMTTSMTVTSPNDKLGLVYNKFRKSDLFSLPVVEEGKFIGMIHLHDTLNTIIQHRERPHFGTKSGEHQHLMDLPVRNIMTKQTVTLPESATLDEVVEQIIENNLDCVSIVDPNNKLLAMITVKDLLKLVSSENEIFLVPKIKIKADFEKVNRESVNIAITEFVKKYSSLLSQAEVEIFLKEHKERHRDQKLIYSRIQIHAHKDKYDAKAEGWGVDHSLKETLEKIEKQIRKKKTARKHNGVRRR